MTAIASVKGTRDFYPEDMAFQRWLYASIRAISEQFGYQEFDGPFLERVELYATKSGDELVREQSFVFPDRSGDLITLRPELTPSLARMIAARSNTLPRPIRWWSFGPFWRYEQPQRGRSREFFQWNIDLLGVNSPEADAEIAAIAAAFLSRVGLRPEAVRILINDRRLAERQLRSIGFPEAQQQTIFRLIDRRERMSLESWEAEARRTGLETRLLERLQATLADREAWRDSEELTRFFRAAEALGAAQYLKYDPSVIRGLDYYTGIVWEARDAAGEFRAILGGGRYDDLISAVGGDPVPGTGFAMGDVVIRLVLEKYDALPKLRTNPADLLIASFEIESREPALQLAARFRQAGLRVEWYPQPDRLPKQLKFADRQGIPLVAILGPEEIDSHRVTLKDMRTGTQESVALVEAVERVKELAAAQAHPSA
ncbi:MAG: histidine--tRNA ligase [Anaerolineales bacterium]